MRLVFWGFSSLARSMWNSFYLHEEKQEVKEAHKKKEKHGAMVMFSRLKLKGCCYTISDNLMHRAEKAYHLDVFPPFVCFLFIYKHNHNLR